MGRTIAVINQKGGVGKTTTVINLGGALAGLGQRVLLVDLDPRGDLSSYLGLRGKDAGESVYEWLFGDAENKDVPARAVGERGLRVVPSSPDLVGAELMLMGEGSARAMQTAVGRLRRARQDCDFVLIDSPPGLQLLSVCALSAAEEVLIPQQCSFLSLHGLRQITENIERMRAVNPGLRLAGILLTMQDRRTVHNREVIGMVREAFGEAVLQTVIPLSVRYQEAGAAGLPIGEYAPGSAQAAAYEQAAREILRKESKPRLSGPAAKR